jgi:hypothetical protein
MLGITFRLVLAQEAETNSFPLTNQNDVLSTGI